MSLPPELLEPMALDSPAPVEVPVTIKTPDGIKVCVLRQADEGAAADYANAQMQGAKWKVFKDPATGADSLKPVGINGLANVRAVLVSRCLYEVLKGKDGVTTRRPFSLDEVKAMDPAVTEPLFERAKAISKLDQKAAQDAKK